MSFSLHGVGVSRGIVIGKVHIIERAELDIVEYSISDEAVPREILRLREAVSQAKLDLRAVRNQIPVKTAVDIAAFIDTHLLMLQDSTFTVDTERIIKERRCNAEWALKLQHDALAQAFDDMDDPYLRTRKDDVDHVVSRIQRILLNHAPLKLEIQGHRLKGMIVLADELTPADTVLMKRNGVTAFATDSGGPTSHMSILARSLGIPGIVGVHGIRKYVCENELLIIDATEGVVIGDADTATLAFYRDKQAERERHIVSLHRLRSAPAVTLDGCAVDLQANVDLPEDFIAAQEVGASGVGLYRTEFLYMNRSKSPDEQEHFESYRSLIEALDGLPVTIRTLDLGADKDFDIHSERHVAANPALGLRAIRLSLREPSLYWPQLRAIVRASAFGPVRLLIPMVSILEEARQVIANVRSVQSDCAKKGLAFDANMPIGGMIEVPAAAICADQFAQYLDFFSIGTNDLIQYTIAIDRINDAVNYLYDPLNLAVLRLIAGIIDAGATESIPVGMCGEMAGDIRYTKLLLGLGLRQFSAHPSLLLELKHIVNETDVSSIEESARRALKATNPDELKALLAGLV
jgi:phosphoenolpyruvate-protein phosphotransferase (PTS system enzyme I)